MAVQVVVDLMIDQVFRIQVVNKAKAIEAEEVIEEVMVQAAAAAVLVKMDIMLPQYTKEDLGEMEFNRLFLEQLITMAVEVEVALITIAPVQ
jgi:hypothetical protein